MENNTPVENNTPYQMPTFHYTDKKYGCYIYYGAFDHKKGKMFPAKLRKLSDYCPFRGFEELRVHFNNGKKPMTAYLEKNVLPRMREDIISGQFDTGIDVKEWTALLQRRKSAEFAPIGDLIDEYIQARYQTEEGISTQDLYYNSLTAFKNSLESIFTKAGLKQTTLKDVNETVCNKVFENWRKYQTWSAQTRKTYRDKVKAFFTAHSKVVPNNPVTRASAVQGDETYRNQPLSRQDFNKIIKHLRSSEKKKHQELLGLSLLIFTGLLRPDTIYKLRCSYFKKLNANYYSVEINSNIIKNAVSGSIIIPAYVIDILIASGNYDPAQPEKLLFPPNLKPRPDRSSKSFRRRKGEHLRNRMWGSNLWNDVLRNELGFSKEFASLHNIYCLKPTGALYLLKEEKWDIVLIQHQMLHKFMMTTCIYLQKLKYHDSDPAERSFTKNVLENFAENLATDTDSPQKNFSERIQIPNEMNPLVPYLRF